MNFISDVGQVQDLSDVLLLDFYGTVSDGLLWETLGPRDFGLVQKFLFEGRPDLVSDWMLGRVDAETVTRFLAEKTDISYDQLWNGLVESSISLRPSENIGLILSDLSEVIDVGLLTGNMDTLQRFTLREPLPGVSFVASTSTLRQSKSEFLKCLMFRRSQSGKKTYLVDDCASVVELARDLGIASNRTSSLEHTVALLKELSASLRTQRELPKRRAA